MTTKDPVLSAFLLTVFSLMMVSGIADFLATSRLAKWLCLNRRKIWRELGRPGTTFFKGDPDNGYFRRTSALSAMYRIMPLSNYGQQLADTDAERYIRLYKIFRLTGIISMILFGAGIFWGILLDQNKPAAPPSHSSP